ncbi:MarR family winged helix-turn-helix transcriptional regulator [Roseateles violae]|uniref:MarR family winged helix-turn-helix transcriptional regulator n=1 Tax=Roseateles violae TaxID=3058042 RepID=A0ABT8DXV8_9BURK|nr:MarR family winged helix-turn-helix transcriptional regulator [Pelomonas sp. PFR6]MDN3922513.1 MarR family winged helix-turn-helix transcriptional regulator [Pelomonas sp. PFR6]
MDLPDSWRDPLPDGSTLAIRDFPGVLMVGTATAIQRNLTKPALDVFELGLPEWRLLSFLHENGRSIAGEIASRTWMDKAQISRVLDALVARGLVQRDSDPQHKQRLLVELTNRGRQLQAQSFKATRGRQSELLTVLALSERKALFSALKKLQRFAEAA